MAWAIEVPRPWHCHTPAVSSHDTMPLDDEEFFTCDFFCQNKERNKLVENIKELARNLLGYTIIRLEIVSENREGL